MEKRIIYTNDACARYDYLAERRDNGEEGLAERTDEELWYLAYEMTEDDLGTVEANLDSEPGGDIILIGKLERWNGSYSVHKNLGTADLGESLREAMSCFGGDNTFEISVDGGKMLLRQWGHDNPVNPSVMEFRVLNKGADYDELEACEIEENSFSPAGTVAKIYGWDAA